MHAFPISVAQEHEQNMIEQTLLTVDLEATCWGTRHTPDDAAQSLHNIEIIEIGCALANRKGDLLDSQ
ncbi:hypothetical protein [Marinobacter nauticus]|uniref:hypothetical protein n=1 Tax=Marinobacter nauticus TaxID=2743 RepID=UPI001E62C398|nr:hypothetical protein [Marinobacter nauticus]